ncbi:hypothetical protein MKW98_018943 [Papaver atlanticum]|uniref:Cytochrome P450 n=1 Tax=Papaver atlanticum TaxID=357466 RepID=A0AAD4XYT7_9MAGN|nr:hypothetical protein MKW98_018943 [Papaver atlanticum]
MDRLNQLSSLFSSSSSNLHEYKIQISTFLIGILFAYIFLHRWNQRNIKGPKSWPIIGAIIELQMNLHRMHDWLTDYFVESKTFRVQLPNITITFISEPANVEHVLKTNFNNYPKGEAFHELMEGFLGDGIFNSDGEMWRRQRKIASLEFASRNLRNFSTTVFRDYALILSGILHQASICGKEIDMQAKEMIGYKPEDLESFTAKVTQFASLLNYDSLAKLSYLHATITETLRLFSAVPQDPKGVLEDDVLPDGTKVRAGGVVAYVPYAMGRMVYNWGPDATSFNPDRWFNKDGLFQSESPFKFTAFQAGPRTCLGKDSAYLQMKMTLAILCRFFNFHLIPNHPVNYKMMTTLTMEHGLKLTMTTRQS